MVVEMAQFEGKEVENDTLNNTVSKCWRDGRGWKCC